MLCSVEEGAQHSAGSFRMDLSAKFGKEIPSRNLRKKRSEIGRKHPSRDVIFPPKFGQKTRKMITSHDVLEPLKQVLLASRDVIISGQICGSKLLRESETTIKIKFAFFGGGGGQGGREENCPKRYFSWENATTIKF